MEQLALIFSLVAAAAASPDYCWPSPRLDGKIIGGKAAFVEDYNYQCSLVYQGSHICGCFIISPLFAVTAAHCTDGTSVSNHTIRAGSSFRNTGGVVVSLETYHQHPNYDRKTFDYDISILQFASELTFGVSIGPISLPKPNQEVASRTPAVVTGWGTTKEEGALLRQLQTVEVPIASLEACRTAYARFPAANVTQHMICAGPFEEAKEAACQGDSGNPLVVDGVVVGIVSWGLGCSLSRFPGVYTSVPNLREYITEITGL